MSWIILAFLAYFCWAGSNLGDKIVSSLYFKNSLVYLFYGFLTAPIVSVFAFFVKIGSPTMNILVGSFLSALLYFLVSVFYIKAVAIEEISRVNMLWNMSPIFSLSIAWLFLGERLDRQQLMVLFLLMVAAVLASFHARGKMIKLSLGAFYMLVECLFYGAYAVTTKYFNQDASFFTFYFYFSLWLVVLPFLLFLSKEFRRVFKSETKQLNYKIVLMMIGVSILARAGVFFIQRAFTLGPVAIINAFEGVQTVTVFFIAILLTRFYPKILKEEVDYKNILFKVGALILMVLGVAFLSLK
jgi:drug/metabolite transporter (DMT)-like permease